MGKNHISALGKRFGRLVLKEMMPIVAGKVSYKCTCDCGNERKIDYLNITRKKNPTRSCGCIWKENIKKKNTKYPNRYGMNAIYNAYAGGAKTRGYLFELSRVQFEEITSKNCIYCNSSPSNISSEYAAQERYVYNGIDRVDNSIGYLYSNCVPCCKVCNQMKKAESLEFFVSHVEKIFTNYIHRRIITL